MAEKRQSLLERLWDRAWPSTIGGLLRAGIAVAMVSFVGFAKFAWNVSPWWSGALAVSLTVVGTCLVVMRQDKPQREAERKKAKTAIYNLSELRSLLAKAEHLLRHLPSERKHGSNAVRAWKNAVAEVASSADWWRSQGGLPYDIAVLIHNPSARPTQEQKSYGDDEHGERAALSLLIAGIGEATAAYASRIEKT